MPKEKKESCSLRWLAAKMKLPVHDVRDLCKQYGVHIEGSGGNTEGAYLDDFIANAVNDPAVIVPRTLTLCPKCKYRTYMTSAKAENAKDVACYRAAIANECNITKNGGDRRGDDPEQCLKFVEGANQHVPTQMGKFL